MPPQQNRIGSLTYQVREDCRNDQLQSQLGMSTISVVMIIDAGEGREICRAHHLEINCFRINAISLE
ncbi:hypothetical protein EUGRSUZ_C00456 [Eucalyptus grandis]|uniref:Uncharacterized protein n=3 Tax=Eucalyptus grandis TaxID=71139 RepID=A0A059CLC8_EUCGR|nr:hypothetical protein EUGRSUZ_C00456 [Eucalyptus grandis]KAK3435755.1 hypothetical protein EUGRSUZ_C00456 [Eucalyptus grandis]